MLPRIAIFYFTAGTLQDPPCTLDLINAGRTHSRHLDQDIPRLSHQILARRLIAPAVLFGQFKY